MAGILELIPAFLTDPFKALGKILK